MYKDTVHIDLLYKKKKKESKGNSQTMNIQKNILIFATCRLDCFHKM